MSTTQQQTSQFAPSGMNAYNSLQPSLASTLGWYLGGGGPGVGGNGGAGSPFQSPMFRSGLGQGTAAANQQGQTAVSNVGMNEAQFGGGNVPGFLQSQTRQAGYQTSGLSQNAYWNALNSTVGSQLGAAGTASGYKPLQTGSTQTTSGLGTWLPQLLGAALGATTSAFTGGMSGGGGGGGIAPTLGGGSLGQFGFANLMGNTMAGVNPTAPSIGAGAMGAVPGLGATLGDLPPLSGY